MNAAANAVLTGDVLELYQAIVAFHGSVETQRNDLAHGCFGTMEAIPDGVLWMESQHLANFMLNFWDRLEHSTPSGPPIQTSPQEQEEIRAKHLDRMFIYRESYSLTSTPFG